LALITTTGIQTCLKKSVNLARDQGAFSNWYENNPTVFQPNSENPKYISNMANKKLGTARPKKLRNVKK
jgi:hypothetical protein